MNRKKSQKAASSLNSATGLHRKMHEYMARRIEDSEALSDITIPDEESKTKAVVRSARDPSQEYQTDIEAKKCECGIPDIEIGPCKHLIFHARTIGVPLSGLFQTKDSLEGYQAQYPVGLQFVRPTEAEALSIHRNLLNENIRLPLTVRRKAGRPVSKRKKSAYELHTHKRAKIMCSQCHRLGHNKRKCTYMPAP